MDFEDDDIGEIRVQFPSPPTLPPYRSVEECRKDHSQGCRTQMAAKQRADFSTVGHGHQAGEQNYTCDDDVSSVVRY